MDVLGSCHQEELKLALKQGTTLLSCIREQAAKSDTHRLSPDELENQTTVERFVPGGASCPSCRPNTSLLWLPGCWLSWMRRRTPLNSSGPNTI